MPGDFNSFTFVKNQFKSTLKHMHKNPNSKECLTVEHIKEKFKELDVAGTHSPLLMVRVPEPARWVSRTCESFWS